MDKATLGTLVSTSVIGLGGGICKGILEGMNLDTGNYLIYTPLILGALQGGIMGRKLNDKLKKADEKSNGTVARVCGAGFYSMVAGGSIFAGYSLGYVIGRIYHLS